MRYAVQVDAREDESSFMLLAKCVHDIEWLGHVIGRPARQVSSFGGLYRFHAGLGPEEAAERCLDCVSSKSARTPRRRSICPVSAT
jgi:hypothetical protein